MIQVALLSLQTSQSLFLLLLVLRPALRKRLCGPSGIGHVDSVAFELRSTQSRSASMSTALH